MRTSEAIDEISAALVAAQAEMPSVQKTALNPHFRNKYAPLDAIVKATAPVLAKHGLAVVQGGNGGEDRQDGRVCITTRIVHASGQFIESDLWMKPQRDDPQGVGACVTYGSRYGYRMLGVITDEDDDGNAASGNGGKGNAKTAAKKAEAPADTQGQDWYKDVMLDHFAKAKKTIGAVSYKAVLTEFGRKHANEIRSKDESERILARLREVAREKKAAKGAA